jgi:hypothetical protein
MKAGSASDAAAGGGDTGGGGDFGAGGGGAGTGVAFHGSSWARNMTVEAESADGACGVGGTRREADSSGVTGA